MTNWLTSEMEERRIAGEKGVDAGAFVLKRGSAMLRVIVSNGKGWDHVSVSLPTRCPTWDEMCYVKSVFFSDEETVMQLHPPKSQWINNHPFCLHLWRPQAQAEIETIRKQWGDEWEYGDIEADGAIPLPPAIMVGLKELNCK